MLLCQSCQNSKSLMRWTTLKKPLTPILQTSKATSHSSNHPFFSPHCTQWPYFQISSPNFNRFPSWNPCILSRSLPIKLLLMTSLLASVIALKKSLMLLRRSQKKGVSKKKRQLMSFKERWREKKNSLNRSEWRLLWLKRCRIRKMKTSKRWSRRLRKNLKDRSKDSKRRKLPCSKS